MSQAKTSNGEKKDDDICSRVPSIPASCCVSLISLKISEKMITDPIPTINECDEEICLAFLPIDSIEDYEDSSIEDMVDDVESLIDELSMIPSEIDAHLDESSTGHDELLHEYSTTTTVAFCRRFLNLLRETQVCKVKSNAYLSLIHSILPHPNNLPSSVEKLLAKLEVKRNVFDRRTVCVRCRVEISPVAEACSYCASTSSEPNLAFIYDADLIHFVDALIKRLYHSIVEYKKKIKSEMDNPHQNDIPFGSLYRNILRRYPNSNLISALLHLDGISLSKSSKLKLWLFSFALVELPPTIRFARHNMPVVSIWVGHTDPIADLWLPKAMSSLSALKRTGKSQIMHSFPPECFVSSVSSNSLTSLPTTTYGKYRSLFSLCHEKASNFALSTM